MRLTALSPCQGGSKAQGEHISPEESLEEVARSRVPAAGADVGVTTALQGL